MDQEMKMGRNDIDNRVKMYIPMVGYLADILGPDSEIVLHDFCDPRKSIIAIKNNHFSKRVVGDTVSDFAFELIKQNAEKKTFIKSEKMLNEKLVRSYTYFIKDEQCNLMGALCINTDLSRFIRLKELAEHFLSDENDSSEKELTRKDHDVDMLEFAYSKINRIIKEFGITLKRAKPEEKIELIRQLNSTGVFQVKGVVAKVAEKLFVSEATVYRYLKVTNELKP